VGNPGLADSLAARGNEIVDVVSGASGLRAYYLIRAGSDTISVTVCNDEAGAQQTNELAASWIRENMPDAASSPPEVAVGEVVLTTE
jgi:hypothetical protein